MNGLRYVGNQHHPGREWFVVQGINHLGVIVDGLEHRGRWIWQVYPYPQSESGDGFIIRARAPHSAKWRHFGAYQGMAYAQRQAERKDDVESGPFFARYYPDDGPDTDDDYPLDLGYGD